MVPATFMSAVTITYFFIAPECLGKFRPFTNNTKIAYPVGMALALLFLIIFLRSMKKHRNSSPTVA